MPFWKDPPPAHVFEFSDAGIAHARGTHVEFAKLPHDAIRQVVPPDAGAKKRRQAAVLLPDSSARISVLDFDSFPDSAEEQLSLVRFRVKKTIPFDIDSAAVSHYRQPGVNRKGKIEVVAVTVPLEILARYEALFRNAGFHPGDITVSALAALNLCHDPEPAIVAKLAEKTLTLMVVAEGKLKLFRCLTLETANEDEILSVLQPTLAYAEDELGAPVKRILACGDPGVWRLASGHLAAEPLHSRLGTPGPFNAGLYGYLESVA